MPVTSSTEYGGRTRSVVSESVTSYAAGTRLTVTTTGATGLVNLLRLKIKRTAGTAASFTPRVYSTAAAGIGDAAQEFAGSSTVIADLFDVAISGATFVTDANGRFYVEPGPNAGADNAFDLVLTYEVL